MLKILMNQFEPLNGKLGEEENLSSPRSFSFIYTSLLHLWILILPPSFFFRREYVDSDSDSEGGDQRPKVDDDEEEGEARPTPPGAESGSDD